LARLVFRVTPLAKIAATVGGVGAALAIYGKLQGVFWASGVGAGLLFAGAIVYYVERFRMMRRRREPER
jgi:hypothetical protein